MNWFEVAFRNTNKNYKSFRRFGCILMAFFGRKHDLLCQTEAFFWQHFWWLHKESISDMCSKPCYDNLCKNMHIQFLRVFFSPCMKQTILTSRSDLYFADTVQPIVGRHCYLHQPHELAAAMQLTVSCVPTL